MPSTTETATHVYIKQDNPTGLLQRYTGPYKIVSRPSHSTIMVKIGTYKSGVENIQLHHWSNAKPAHMREGQEEAVMVPRGRPPKKPEVSLEPPTTTTTVVTEGSGQTDSKPTPKPKLPKVNKQPTRRSERIQNKIHETSSLECDISTVPPQRRGWTATTADLALINASINVRSGYING